MRSLYWKIFTSFWLAIVLIILTTTWVTSQIAHKSSLPEREQLFMDSYANGAVATFESGQKTALLKWLNQIGISRHMTMYLLSSTGEIIGRDAPPQDVKYVAENHLKDKLDEGMFKSGRLIISHEILSTSGTYYRLAAVSEKPLSYFVRIPWASLTIWLTLAALISGVICYLLSIYLTKPLRYLGQAAKSIATGQLSTRVGYLRGHGKDEIAVLSDEFDRMAEQLENLIRSKERLIQDISHELRSPLARLNVAIELGRNKAGHLVNTEFDRMELECLRLNVLINEILEYARLDKSTMDLHLEEVSILSLINGIIDDANYEAGGEFPRVIYGTQNQALVSIDQRLIHRALENVIRNALNYSPGNRQIIIDVHHTDLFLFIEIADNGPGVPEDQLEMIFNPFYRVDTSRTKQTGGHGLGLAIAARAIGLHNGTIQAWNRDQGGLCVRITLPM